jgi:glycosyltransferase involved in cell wall biosynthesis
MRVLWLIDSLTLGGAEALVPAFARAVDGREVELHVAFLKSLGGNPFEAELRAMGIPVTHLRARHLRDLGALRRLLRLLRGERFEVVHAHLTYAAIWGALAARATGVPCVATLHTGPVEAGAWSAAAVRERLLGAALRRWCRAVILVSEAARAQHVERGRLPAGRMRVIHNGVDVDAFAKGRRDETRRALGLAAGQPALLTVSALREGKGLEVLLRALPLVLRARPDARLFIAGEGALRSRLEEQARGLGIGSAVTWLGLRRDIADLLAAADAFVLASRQDAFPTVLLEAMAAARPVVATWVGGIPEIVADGETGVLVEPGDAEALAAAIGGLFADPSAAGVMGRAGRALARERFSTARWTERLVALYREVVEARRAAGAAVEAA